MSSCWVRYDYCLPSILWIIILIDQCALYSSSAQWTLRVQSQIFQHTSELVFVINYKYLLVSFFHCSSLACTRKGMITGKFLGRDSFFKLTYAEGLSLSSSSTSGPRCRHIKPHRWESEGDTDRWWQVSYASAVSKLISTFGLYQINSLDRNKSNNQDSKTWGAVIRWIFFISTRSQFSKSSKVMDDE